MHLETLSAVYDTYSVTSELSIKINWSPKNVTEEVIQNVAMILATSVGTVPYDRELGIDASAIDTPPFVAQAVVARMVIQKIAKYEPRAYISEIQFLPSESSDVLKLRVVIGVKNDSSR